MSTKCLTFTESYVKKEIILLETNPFDESDYSGEYYRSNNLALNPIIFYVKFNFKFRFNS